MATKTIYFYLNPSEQGFISKILKNEEDFDSSDIDNLRKIISKQKGKIIYFLKNKKIKSIYNLAKILGRDFKSVYSDLKILEKFGFIEFILEKNGNKEKLIPKLKYQRIELILEI
ncbi:MAG: hypothetical protein QXG18_00025 [Candidatus Pacearchaeota archaeon]